MTRGSRRRPPRTSAASAVGLAAPPGRRDRSRPARRAGPRGPASSCSRTSISATSLDRAALIGTESLSGARRSASSGQQLAPIVARHEPRRAANAAARSPRHRRRRRARPRGDEFVPRAPGRPRLAPQPRARRPPGGPHPSTARSPHACAVSRCRRVRSARPGSRLRARVRPRSSQHALAPGSGGCALARRARDRPRPGRSARIGGGRLTARPRGRRPRACLGRRAAPAARPARPSRELSPPRLAAARSASSTTQSRAPRFLDVAHAPSACAPRAARAASSARSAPLRGLARRRLARPLPPVVLARRGARASRSARRAGRRPQS